MQLVDKIVPKTNGFATDDIGNSGTRSHVLIVSERYDRKDCISGDIRICWRKRCAGRILVPGKFVGMLSD